MIRTVRPPLYRPRRMLARLRQAAAEFVVGHPSPLRLIDSLAETVLMRDADLRRSFRAEHDRTNELAGVVDEQRRRLELLEARVSELYVDGSLIGELERASTARRHRGHA